MDQLKEIRAEIEKLAGRPLSYDSIRQLADLHGAAMALELVRPSPPPACGKIERPETATQPARASTGGGSEFLRKVDGRDLRRVWGVVDEFVEAVRVLHPNLYAALLDRIADA